MRARTTAKLLRPNLALLPVGGRRRVRVCGSGAPREAPSLLEKLNKKKEAGIQRTLTLTRRNKGPPKKLNRDPRGGWVGQMPKKGPGSDFFPVLFLSCF
jgi:hypothetical protein